MSLRGRVAQEVFGRRRAMRFPAGGPCRVASGTGTNTAGGVITFSSATGKCYIVVTSGVSTATLIST